MVQQVGHQRLTGPEPRRSQIAGGAADGVRDTDLCSVLAQVCGRTVEILSALASAETDATFPSAALAARCVAVIVTQTCAALRAGATGGAEIGGIAVSIAIALAISMPGATASAIQESN